MFLAWHGVIIAKYYAISFKQSDCFLYVREQTQFSIPGGVLYRANI